MSNNPDFLFTQDLVRRIGIQVKSAIVAGYTTTWKPDNTPVTEVDISVNQKIIDEIHQAYPNDRIFGEELSLGGKSGFTWVVDPIDGTQALGIVPTSTTCIARIDQTGRPLFGVVYNSATDELFAAARDQPSTLNGRGLRVSTKSDVKGSYIFLGSRMPDMVATNGTVYDRLEAQGAKVINVRSLSFSCMMVAAGKAQGAFIGVKTPFEAASVMLIVEGAGGKVSDLYGGEPGRLDGEIKGMVVSNGLVHEALLLALQRDTHE